MLKIIEEHKDHDFMKDIDMPCTACQYYYCDEERGYICMFIRCVYQNEVRK